VNENARVQPHQHLSDLSSLRDHEAWEVSHGDMVTATPIRASRMLKDAQSIYKKPILKWWLHMVTLLKTSKNLSFWGVTTILQLLLSDPWHGGTGSGTAACQSSSAVGTSSTNVAAHAGVASTGPWSACAPRGFPCAFRCPCGDPYAWHPGSCARASGNAWSRPAIRKARCQGAQ